MEKAAIVSVLALCVIGFGSGFHVSYDDCGKLHSCVISQRRSNFDFLCSSQIDYLCGWFQCKKKINKVLIIPLYNEWAAFHWIKLREELRDSGRWSMTSLNIQRRSLERLHIHFRLYIMFLLARNTFPFLEHNSSKRRESKPIQKQY